MTEAEWGSATDPYGMIQTARRRAGERKQRLFAVACCRHISHLLVHDDLRAAVDAGEGYADGLVPRAARDGAYAVLDEPRDLLADAATAEEHGSIPSELATYSEQAKGAGVPLPAVVHAADAALMAAQSGEVQSADPGYYPGSYYPAALAAREFASPGRPEEEPDPAEFAFQCRLIRDIFGNPFRPAAFEPAWQTSTVVSLARQMYEARDFGPIPILADALLDAGCDSQEVLDHCRGEGPHVRGCWVLDLILGRE
ncbi:MAG: hypothetical protein JWO38_4409 [Gemmataceae bacterium]|nr:hypothetical protein [Gemmataceae bacterium]